MGADPDSTVEVVIYRDEWPTQFEAERACLSDAVGDAAKEIDHIGSTAVPGLSAKPTIDILMVVEDVDDFLDRLRWVEALGYDYRPQNSFVGDEDHLFLRKVIGGKRTHHLHVLRAGSAEIDDYRLFREALRTNPALADRYERLKVALAARWADDRMRYVTEKEAWVDDVMISLRGAAGSAW